MSIDLPEGKKLSLMEFNREYGHKYSKLTEKEKMKYVHELENARNKQSLFVHQLVRKLGRAADADIRTTINTIVESSLHLNDRAGYAVMAFGARTDHAGTRE